MNYINDLLRLKSQMDGQYIHLKVSIVLKGSGELIPLLDPLTNDFSAEWTVQMFTSVRTCQGVIMLVLP